MHKAVTIIALTLLLSGCSVFGGVSEKVAEYIDDYCTKEPYSARQVYREQINTELASKGHSVSIVCNGDPNGS